ncbi:Hypothetical predicted protein [Xyrichtys novacula]|uniref:Uncharacterized protein n=1 Tax=Xyrichtys novacula TaxID=13765 RepID=A0AAV1GJN6_XYRNO|nr:Hypothetical predicted protein [Xyrichtys novacula]
MAYRRLYHVTTPCVKCEVVSHSANQGRTATHSSQILRYPSEQPRNRCARTCTKGHVGRRTARESITARCACEVTPESQSVPLLLGEASAGRDRWERESVIWSHGGEEGDRATFV